MPEMEVFTYLMLSDIRDNIAIKLDYNMTQNLFTYLHLHIEMVHKFGLNMAKMYLHIYIWKLFHYFTSRIW